MTSFDLDITISTVIIDLLTRTRLAGLPGKESHDVDVCARSVIEGYRVRVVAISFYDGEVQWKTGNYYYVVRLPEETVCRAFLHSLFIVYGGLSLRAVQINDDSAL